MKQKNVLLMAGAGTLGSYTALELLRLGFHVDCIALEDLQSFNKNYTYIKAPVSDELLNSLFEKNYYDCIVDFIHYSDWENYPSRGTLLLQHTDQLIFLSSYRVYANEQHPITENAPQLLHTMKDEEFLEHEGYAIPKSHNEEFFRRSEHQNWTIIRPVISFSHFRFDIVTQNSEVMLPRILQHKKVLLPSCCKEVVAGLGWAGNSGKMIAHLCCNERALGEDFTIGTSEKNTWEQVAEMYSEVTGVEFEWVDTDTYFEYGTTDRMMLIYDRAWDRTINNSKVLKATGLTPSDFISVKDGLIYEFNYMMDRPDLVEKYNTERARRICAKMDIYFERKVEK